MASFFWPADSGAVTWKPPVPTQANLPATLNTAGDARVAIDTGIVYVWSGSSWNAPSGAGTVTSVAITVPNILSVAGSPITGAGTFALSLANQTGNTILCSPANGSNGTPTFRSLAGADLPLPAVATLGGVFSKAVVSHNFLTGISSVDGSVSAAQPAFTDISGTVAASQLPNPSASTLGGIQSAAAVSHQWINSISTSGVPALSQPAFTDISGTASAAQLPLPGAASLGGVFSKAVVSHNFLTGISSVDGSVSAAQPAFTDISGSLNLATQVTGNLAVANLNSGTSASSSTFWRGDGTWSAAILTLSAFGSSPNSNGAAISGVNLTLQPADGSNPGGVSTAAQSFGGLKTFTAGALIEGLLLNEVTKTSDYTTIATDGLIEANAVSNNITVTLLTAVGNAGLIQCVKKTDTSTHTVTIATTSAQTIDGRGSSAIVLNAPNDVLTVLSNGANWDILAKKETQYLGVTSNAFAMSGTSSGNYPTMVNNSVSLTPGQWTVNYYFTVFTGTSGVSAGVDGGGLFAANGANSSSSPTALTGVFGNNVVTSLVGFTVGIPANTVFQTATISIDVYVTTNTQVFVVPVLSYGTASNASISGTISARRAW